MTRTLKKLTAVLLALALVAGLLPMSVLAAQTDAAATGAEMVSLTVFGVTPGVPPVKSIDPEPSEITIDPHGYPVYWYPKNTSISSIF